MINLDNRTSKNALDIRVPLQTRRHCSLSCTDMQNQYIVSSSDCISMPSAQTPDNYIFEGELKKYTRD